MIPAAWRPFSQIHHISLEEKTVLGWFSADCGPDLHTCPLVGFENIYFPNDLILFLSDFFGTGLVQE